MTRQDHLMVRAMEECAELAHRISKAIVFNLDDHNPEIPGAKDNRTLIREEFIDLLAVMEMAGLGIQANTPTDAAAFLKAVADKQARVEKFLLRSKELGRLEDEFGWNL